MKQPNLAQWCAIWATAVSSAFVWVNIPKALVPHHWPYFIFRMTEHDRDRAAIALVVMGTLLIWSLRKLDIVNLATTAVKIVFPTRRAVAWTVAVALLGIVLGILRAVAGPTDSGQHRDIFDQVNSQQTH